MSLLPEKSIVFSPQLATALGLEEAVLLQVLIEVTAHQTAHSQSGQIWYQIQEQQLLELTPFWQLNDCRRILQNLTGQGVMDARFAHQNGSRIVSFSIDHGTAKKSSPEPAAKPTSPVNTAGAQLLSNSWVPEQDVIAQLNQYGIPDHFLHAQLPEFITYWQERGEPQYSWGSKFLKHTVRSWREQENKDARELREAGMQSDWQPSHDAVEILYRQAGINRNFIEDAIPEFILYWKEKGTRSSTWNSQFVQHVRRQWLKFTAAIECENEPRIMDPHWQPGEDLYEVLKLANIPREFAQKELPAFILYWRETGRPLNSWNTKFLQYIKRQWSYNQLNKDANNHQPSQVRSNGTLKPTDKAVSTRNRSLVEDLTDRSWAN